MRASALAVAAISAIVATAAASQAIPITSSASATTLQSRSEAAFALGHAFTISTGKATVASGNNLCVYLENAGPYTWTIDSRLFTHNLPSNVAQPYFYGISALTGANLPVLTGTATNRNGTATAPGLTIRYGVSNTANLPGGTIGPGNFTHGEQGLGPAFSRTVLPGAKFVQCIEGASTGLGGNADAMEAITLAVFYE